MHLGTDVSSWPTIEAIVTVKGIVFKNKALHVADYRNVNIEEYYKEETMEEEDLNTYVAPSGTDEENTKTGDSIMVYMILCLIGFIGTVLATNKLRKEY